MTKKLIEKISNITFLYEVENTGKHFTDSEFQIAKENDWAIANAVIVGHSPPLVACFYGVAAKASVTSTHTELNKLETEILGSVQTKGPLVRRKRFWKYVRFINVGTTPHGISDTSLLVN